MTVADATLSGTVSPDGTNIRVESFTPAAGEVYYVDAFIFGSDGTGSNGSAEDLKIGTYPSSMTLNASESFNNVVNSATVAAINDDMIELGTASLGFYITDAHTLDAVTKGNISTSATYHYEATIRRVL